MAEKLTPDICIIGGGAAGVSVAIAAAAFGVAVVLIDRRRLDGERLSGGVVSKALLAAAKRAQSMRDGGSFGVTATDVGVDFAKVRDHVRRAAAAIAPNSSAARLTGLGVRVIQGDAQFKDRRTVAVGEAYEIVARRFVIASGSVPALPPIPGLDQGVTLTSETVFALTELPEHLIVIGAGSTGLELAQAFRRMGSQVTVLEAAQPLAKNDRECAAIVLDRLQRERVVIRSGVKVIRIERARGKAQAILQGIEGEESVEGTHLLVAAGNKPSLGGLALEAAGIAFTDSGITVNKSLKTSNRRVYAIGGAAGQSRSAQAATYHAGLVIRNALFRKRVRVNGDIVPAVTCTEPELAQAGLTEAEARNRGIAIKISRWPYNDNDRAQIERETRGHIKVVTTRNGKIIGTSIVGANAGELIAAWALAVAQGLNISAFAELMLPYPTLSEIGKSAAIDFFTPRLTSLWVRRIIAWLRIFG